MLKYFNRLSEQFLISSASIISALLIVLALTAVHPEVVQVQVVQADNCSWFVVNADDDTGCTLYTPWSDGIHADCLMCSDTGGSTGGGGGVPTCPNPFTQDVGCPAGTYSGSHTVTYSYQLNQTCVPSGNILPDGSPDCASYTYSCDEYQSGESNTCVPTQYCSDPNGVVTPAPGNDIANCPPGPTVDCSVDQWTDCNAVNTPGTVPPNTPYSESWHYDYPQQFQNGVSYCAWALGPWNVEQGGHIDYCNANPGDPTCCSVPPPPPSPPVVTTITVTSPVSWVINPEGKTTSPALVNPSPSGTTYTVTPDSSCLTPNITNTQGGGSSVTLFGGESVSFTITCAPPPAVFSYHLATASLPQPVVQGDTTQIQVSGVLDTGTTQNVSLNVSWPGGQPTGVGYNVTPSAGCSPTCLFTINLSSTLATPPGTYTLNVSGSPAASNGTLSYSFVVNRAPLSGDPGGSSDPNPGKTGQPISFSSCTVTGGLPPFTYTLKSLSVPAGFPDQTHTTSNTQYTFTYTFDKAGTYPFRIDVSDSSSPTQTISCNPGSEKIVLGAQFKEF